MDIFVGVVLTDNKDRIYLIKEDDKNKIGKNRWNLPGGSVDTGENLLEAVERETLEETGFRCKVESLLGCYVCKKQTTSWVYVVFSAITNIKKQEPTDVEVKKGRWFIKSQFLHMTSENLVHPDMQLVYNIAITDSGGSLDAVKYIDYNVQ